MQIIVGKTAGFCFGIANAVNKAKQECEKDGVTYCLGDLANNNQVMEDLSTKGLKIANSLDEVASGQTCIIRAHGVAKEVYKQAEEAGISLVDLTCPKVLKVHKIAEEYANKDYYIFLVGKAKHPEIIGTISCCGAAAEIIETIEDVEKAIRNFKESGKIHAVAICQTTFSMTKFEKLVERIQNKLDVEVINTICEATKVRQEETEIIAKQVDLMIVIGGRHSSNSTKLYEVAKRYCKDSIHIETEDELNIEKLKKINKIGIMAGASTPRNCIEKVVEKLNTI